MLPQSNLPSRLKKLTRFLHDVSSGKRRINSAMDAQLFIEAIRSQESPSICVETLVGSSNGVEALGKSIRADLSPSFIHSHALNLILFLSDPAVKVLASGQLLDQILRAIVTPPTFWDALVKLYLNGQMEDQYSFPFAWLVHALVSSPSGPPEKIICDIEAVAKKGGLASSESHETRELAYKITRILELKHTPIPQSHFPEASPGGRHDNDLVNFRRISIYPTRDELLAKEKPFYRRAKELLECSHNMRLALHLDNQFRLLREDMLYDLRDNLQTALGST